MSGNNPLYPAGWYPDTNMPGTERYYDGNGWTQHTRPTFVAPAPAVPTPATAFAMPVAATAPTVASTPTAKVAWYKRKGVMIPVAAVGGLIVISGIAGALGGGDDKAEVAQASKPTASAEPAAEVEKVVYIAVPSVVGMSGADAQATLQALGLKADIGGGDPTMPVTAQSLAEGSETAAGSKVVLTLAEKPKLTLGQENAIKSAKSYLSYSAFSRAGLYQQLTSEYGEGFSAEDAEFAIATLEQTGLVDWNAEAAESAKSYLNYSSFSRDGLYEQLTSEYGEGFTPEQANAGLAAVGY